MKIESDFDVVVVGSGPAGVSVSFPLVEKGHKTLMVDGGLTEAKPIPTRSFLEERGDNPDQWRWMLGEDFHALRRVEAVSPKFRVPAHAYAFQDFRESNRIHSEEVISVGSMAVGGLSNVWGCGVAKWSEAELAAFPFPASDITASYKRVANRMGISGQNPDDMSAYLGVDDWADPALPADDLNEWVLGRYAAAGTIPGFRVGRARVAVLAQDREKRKACGLSGNCLWGCSQASLYSAAQDIPALLRYPSFCYERGLVVQNIRSEGDLLVVECSRGGEPRSIRARKVALAAGTLASTRLAASAIGHYQPMRLQSCPTAAFLLWIPRKMGSGIGPGFGLGQLSFAMSLPSEITAFGSTFSTSGIPVTEFVRHLPMRVRYGIDLLRQLLSACLVGNLFLPGNLSSLSTRLEANGSLRIEGDNGPTVPKVMRQASRQLGAAFRRLGAVLVPMSFSVGAPGSDVHYASTLPMREHPQLGETTADGEVVGIPNLHVADAACLPYLSEKSHTLTMMANADRIGRSIA